MSQHAFEVPEQARLLSGLYNNLALAVARDGAVETAVAMLRRAVALDPFDLGRRVNLASQLIAIGEDDEAETLVSAALTQADNIVSAWQMLAVLKTHRGLLGEAIACFERAYALSDHGQSKFDLAAAYLRAGDFARGLPLYERRHEILPRTGPKPPGPTWTGEKVKHLCVWGDQGYGDRVMFARFLPWARERCDKLTFLTDPATVALLHGYRAVADVGCFYPKDVVFDAQICLASLPLLYGLTPDNIPPDPQLLSPATTTGGLMATGLKIGLAWQGNKDHPNDNIRSMPFTELLPLAADPRNDCFSLQCGPAAADVGKARAQRIVGEMAGMIEGEWAHTAAVIQSLDLIVTVDTAIAHIAGALGVRCFLMLPRFSDWRWLHGRDDTPWYPSVRLFRQEKALDWRGVVRRVVTAVNQLHQDRAMVRIISREIRAAAAGYEPDVSGVMRRVLRPGDTFVDVGANVGKHTTLGAELVGPAGRVLAFEPGANALPELREVTRDLPQVEIIEQPAWHEAADLEFHLCADGSGGNAVWDPGQFPTNDRTRAAPETMLLRATTLDAEVERRQLRPRLIKIDCEGAEQRILEGAAGVLFEQRPPFVIAELHQFGLDKLGCSQQSLRELMASVGYSTFVLFADGGMPQLMPPGATIETRYVVNLLFATPEDVAACWPSMPIAFGTPERRAMHAYVHHTAGFDAPKASSAA